MVCESGTIIQTNKQNSPSLEQERTVIPYGHLIRLIRNHIRVPECLTIFF